MGKKPVVTAAAGREILENLAGELVLAGPSDLQALAQVHAGLQELAGVPEVAQRPLLAQAAAEAVALVEKVILSEVAAPAAALDTVARTVSALQSVLSAGCGEHEVAWPPELGLPLPAGADAAAPAAGAVTLPPQVDAGIFAEFLARQPGVLDEAEELVLALEKGAGGEPLAQLKRLVHTLKGESALLGLGDVERLCHAAEDALGARPASELTEALLGAVDWLRQTFAACAGQAGSPGPAAPHLERLASSDTGATPGPVAGATLGPVEAAAPEPAVSPTGGSPLSGDPALLGEFVNEAREHLEAADVHLLTLEKDPRQDDALNAVFRAFHTIKGVAGFLGLEEIGHLAHDTENLLDRARKGKLVLSGLAINVTFEAVDAMKRLVDALCAALSTGGLLPAEPSLPALLGRLRAACEGQADAGSLAGPAAAAPPAGTAAASPESGAAPAAAPRAAAAASGGAAADAPGEAVPPRGPAAAETPPAGGPAAGAGQAIVAVKEAVKVDADRLDRLVDAIGELVIAESMVSQSLQQQCVADRQLARQLGQLDKITRELQTMATSLRMVPIKATFQKMARLVRDLSHKAGKPVDFVMCGEDTELDKTVVDKIGDPLVHMVRNAVDHGLEGSPAARRQAGKAEQGRIELRAFHRGGNICIEIEDDGRGLDREAIVAKARERGLLREGETPSDREIYSLIFQPGFSTAKKITEVSGRGVGMDVVRRAIEGLRGQIDIRTEKGRGSVFSIRLPLTMAIIDGMILRVGAERYILPTLAIVRSVQPQPREVNSVLHRGEMLAIEGRLIPLFRLDRLYGIAGAEQDPTRALAVVIEADGRQTALLVDELLGQQQIVIKNIGKAMQTMPGIAGGAIMPDGRVGLILDPSGLVKMGQNGGRAAGTA